jgi:hypothetical protein
VLNRAKLEALGFRMAPRTTKWDGAHHKDLLDRKAYAVFELNGEAWAALLQQKQAELVESLAKARNDSERKSRQDEFERFSKNTSRLVLVDAGLDPAALRARFADRSKYLIAKVKVSAYPAYSGMADSKEDIAYGHITLLSGEIDIPHEFHALIAPPGAAPRPRVWQYNPLLPDAAPYQVTVAYGQRYEPWVEGVAGR